MEYTKDELWKEIIDIICCESSSYGPEDMTRDIMEIPIIKSASDLYEALKVASVTIHNAIRYAEGGYREMLQENLKQAGKAIAKAEGK